MRILRPPRDRPRVIAGLATRPSRTHTAQLVVKKILPQVDKLVVHLDGFTTIPNWVVHPKIVVDHWQEKSPLGAAGKFLAHDVARDRDIIVFVDDDVNLPRGFIRRLVKVVESWPVPAIIGFHGSHLNPGIGSYVTSRRVTHLSDGLSRAECVDVLATCAGGYRKRDFTPAFRNWPEYNMVDLQVALDAHEQRVQRILMPRRRNWIRFLEERQEDSIFVSLLEDDSRQTIAAKRLAIRSGYDQTESLLGKKNMAFFERRPN